MGATAGTEIVMSFNVYVPAFKGHSQGSEGGRNEQNPGYS